VLLVLVKRSSKKKKVKKNSKIIRKAKKKAKLNNKPKKQNKIQPQIDSSISEYNGQGILFDVLSENSLELIDKTEIRNLVELVEALKNMSDDIYGYHVSFLKNDFSDWIKNKVKDEKLGLDLFESSTKTEMIKLIEQKISEFDNKKDIITKIVHAKEKALEKYEQEQARKIVEKKRVEKKQLLEKQRKELEEKRRQEKEARKKLKQQRLRETKEKRKIRESQRKARLKEIEKQKKQRQKEQEKLQKEKQRQKEQEKRRIVIEKKKLKQAEKKEKLRIKKEQEKLVKIQAQENNLANKEQKIIQKEKDAKEIMLNKGSEKLIIPEKIPVFDTKNELNKISKASNNDKLQVQKIKKNLLVGVNKGLNVSKKITINGSKYVLLKIKDSNKILKEKALELKDNINKIKIKKDEESKVIKAINDDTKNNDIKIKKIKVNEKLEDNDHHIDRHEITVERFPRKKLNEKIVTTKKIINEIDKHLKNVKTKQISSKKIKEILEKQKEILLKEHEIDVRERKILEVEEKIEQDLSDLKKQKENEDTKLFSKTFIQGIIVGILLIVLSYVIYLKFV
jgi:hypothetical protein